MFGTLCKQPPAMLLHITIQTWTRSILLYCMQYSRSLQKNRMELNSPLMIDGVATKIIICTCNKSDSTLLINWFVSPQSVYNT